MKILITGGNGYIAKSLYKALKDKYDVQSITRQDFDLVDAIATTDFFQNNYFDVIIHCAVSGGHRNKVDGVDVIDNNLRMYYNLLQNRLSYGKFINIASGAEIHTPETPYGLSKKAIAESVLGKDDFYNLRVFAVFDENELDTRFIKASINRYINKEPIQIHQDKYMDFIYMVDLITIIEYYLITKDLNKDINCNYNYTFKLSKIASIINSLDDYRVPIEVKNDLTDNYCGSHSKISINFIGLEQGIKEVYKKMKNGK